MISALGHCEDLGCCQSSSSTHELVRLFRCSIHCDRLLCLFHLNAHNVYYEEEKKQNNAVLNELQNNLTLYQTIFEQHLQEYREIVHQATTVLLHNKSSMVPIEQIRPILEKLQRAITIFQQEKVIIKSESLLDVTDFVIEKIDSNFLKDISSIKTEISSPIKNHEESVQTVVVRLERVDHVLHDEEINKSINESISEDVSHILKPTDENQQEDNKRSRILTPTSSGKKKYERVKKKNDKIIPLKRLQT